LPKCGAFVDNRRHFLNIDDARILRAAGDEQGERVAGGHVRGLRDESFGQGFARAQRAQMLEDAADDRAVHADRGRGAARERLGYLRAERGPRGGRVGGERVFGQLGDQLHG